MKNTLGKEIPKLTGPEAEVVLKEIEFMLWGWTADIGFYAWTEDQKRAWRIKNGKDEDYLNDAWRK